jgi:hypothetical protein
MAAHRFECVDALSHAPASPTGKSDVRMVGLFFVIEPASPRRVNDHSPKRKQFRTEAHLGKEDSGAVKTVQLIN